MKITHLQPTCFGALYAIPQQCKQTVPWLPVLQDRSRPTRAPTMLLRPRYSNSKNDRLYLELAAT